MIIINAINIFGQDNAPAGTIYCEDIDEIAEDFEEAQKDISKVYY